MSQMELADRAGLHRNTIGYLELGRIESVSSETIDAIAAALDVDPIRLVIPTRTYQAAAESLDEFVRSGIARLSRQEIDRLMEAGSFYGELSFGQWLALLQLIRSDEAERGTT